MHLMVLGPLTGNELEAGPQRPVEVSMHLMMLGDP